MLGTDGTPKKTESMRCCAMYILPQRDVGYKRGARMVSGRGQHRECETRTYGDHEVFSLCGRQPMAANVLDDLHHAQAGLRVKGWRLK